jgi:HD superfamily phosphohydrolase YqeK
VAAGPDPHPVIEAAAAGHLPGWVRVGEGRREHLERVAGLVEEWARALGKPEAERVRWRAAGFLHDALKDEPPDELRTRAGRAGSGWPDPLLHGPAVAERLREEGVEDEELLLAVGHHSVGHPAFGALGESLYLADFLDPGRAFHRGERTRLRERLPEERADVLLTVVAWRIGRLLEERRSLMAVTLEFWNDRVGRREGAAG